MRDEFLVSGGAWYGEKIYQGGSGFSRVKDHGVLAHKFNVKREILSGAINTLPMSYALEVSHVQMLGSVLSVYTWVVNRLLRYLNIALSVF